MSFPNICIGETKTLFIWLNFKGKVFSINKFKKELKIIKIKNRLLHFTDINGKKHTYEIFKLMYKYFVDANVKWISNIQPKDGDENNFSVDNLVKVDKEHFNTKKVKVYFLDGTSKIFKSEKDFYTKFGIDYVTKI